MCLGPQTDSFKFTRVRYEVSSAAKVLTAVTHTVTPKTLHRNTLCTDRNMSHSKGHTFSDGSGER